MAKGPKRTRERASKPLQSQVIAKSGSRKPMPTGKQIQLLMNLLDLGYDKDKKDYKPGWSDQIISAETNIGLSTVVKNRQRYYGPVTRAPALPEVRSEKARWRFIEDKLDKIIDLLETLIHVGATGSKEPDEPQGPQGQPQG